MPATQAKGERKAEGLKGNAQSAKPEKKQQDTSSTIAAANSRSGPAIPWIGLVVAVLSLALGLLTPPLLNKPKLAPKPSHVNPTTEKQRQQPNAERKLQQDTPVVSKTDLQPKAAEKMREEVPVIAEQEENSDTLIRQPNPCSEEKLQQFLHDSSFPGFHIICLIPHPEDGEEPQLELIMYKDGLRRQERKASVPFGTDWSELKAAFEEQLELNSAGFEKQPWAIFSPVGEYLVSEDSTETVKGEYPLTLTENHGMVLLYEGGQFLWPGVRIGFERKVELYTVMPKGSPNMGQRNQTVTLKTLSTDPLVLSVLGFLTASECMHIQELATPTLEYSGVVLMDKDKGRPASDWRTSQTTFVSARKDPVLIDIDYRTASLVRVPRNHQEDVQVLRYGLTEKYDAHHDFFDPFLYSQDASTQRLIKNGRRNRLATVFWYLTTVESGGETIFPRFNGAREISFTDCEHGLKVKPEEGKVIIFYSLKPNGERDQNSLHGSCPVKEGLKWAANKWVWNEPMNYVPS